MSQTSSTLAQHGRRLFDHLRGDSKRKGMKLAALKELKKSHNIKNDLEHLLNNEDAFKNAFKKGSCTQKYKQTLRNRLTEYAAHYQQALENEESSSDDSESDSDSSDSDALCASTIQGCVVQDRLNCSSSESDDEKSQVQPPSASGGKGCTMALKSPRTAPVRPASASGGKGYMPAPKSEENKEALLNTVAEGILPAGKGLTGAPEAVKSPRASPEQDHATQILHHPSPVRPQKKGGSAETTEGATKTAHGKLEAKRHTDHKKKGLLRVIPSSSPRSSPPPTRMLNYALNKIITHNKDLFQRILRRMQKLKLTPGACTLYLTHWMHSLEIDETALTTIQHAAKAQGNRSKSEFNKKLILLHCAFNVYPEKKEVTPPNMELPIYERCSLPVPRRALSRTRKGSPNSELHIKRLSDLEEQVKNLTGIVQKVLQAQQTQSKETNALLEQILQAQKRQKTK